MVWEAADVLYFTLARLAGNGTRLEDVARELDRRALSVRRRDGSRTFTGRGPSRRGGIEMRLRRLRTDQVAAIRREAVDGATLAGAAEIVTDVREAGTDALRRWAGKFGELTAEQPISINRDELRRALAGLPTDQRALLERTAQRIRTFAEAQRAALRDVSVPVPGGEAGHTVAPVERAGCYAPGGRYPLPSSVLMTAVTARAAGVAEVWVASPRPAEVTLAAAAVAGADGLLAVGGAHAIAALAYGAGGAPPCDVVVGPGNRWVTAAKKLVAGDVGIDMLAGPSELVILADESADPAIVAADLLAQAEHDPEALPVLVTTDSVLADAVDLELDSQLEGLPTREIAAARPGKRIHGRHHNTRGGRRYLQPPCSGAPPGSRQRCQ